MDAVEVVARALARAYAQGKWVKDPSTDDSHAVRRDAERNWPLHVPAARCLIRSLKDQPAHVAEAGADCLSAIGSLNAILEAMVNA
jgi:hypothetical protein